MTQATSSSKTAGFWESRTGYRSLVAGLMLEPLPGGARWAAAFGSLLLFTVVLQVMTGLLLSMSYSPSVASAWPSVKYINDELPFGRYVRSLHHWGSSAMVILLLAHLVQVFVWGAYKKPRETTWMVGVILLMITLGLAFTGYLLPWDEKAYWASKVGLGVMSTVPLAGDSLRQWLQGGPQLGNLTLTHFFTLHAMILPGLLVLGIAVHLYLFRRHGVTPNWGASDALLREHEAPFWPDQVWKDAVLILALLLALGTWCYFRSAPLGAQADPAQPYDARPEWYFMFMFLLLKHFPPPYEIVATFILPTFFFLVLFFFPLLDRNPARDPRKRPIAISLLAVGSLGLVGLTVYAVATDVRMRQPVLAQSKAPPEAEPAPPLQNLNVVQAYKDHCLSCHAVDGTGKRMRSVLTTIPDFTDMNYQRHRSDAEVIQRIETGKPPLMPAFKGKLAPEQIRWLAFYVRAFAIRSEVPTTRETK
jgi:quinol-cytochrome oxidoreductase complex cytochrome b subunit